MNKQEAKQKLHNLAFAKMNNKPDDLKFADVMQIVDQINESEKVELPEYVADKIDFCKRIGCNLFYSMDFCFQYKDCADWLEHNEEIFARAWLDGFKVEEQKYIVEIPDPNGVWIHTVLEKISNISVRIGRTNEDPCGNKRYALTESEIKQNFEWAWDAGFAKPVEDVE